MFSIVDSSKIFKEQRDIDLVLPVLYSSRRGKCYKKIFDPENVCNISNKKLKLLEHKIN
jgi:hypothetical protein